MADEKSVKVLSLSSWDTHLIDPSKKTAEWGYDFFITNKGTQRPAFGGWYQNFDPLLIRQFAYGNQPIERYKVQFDPQDKESIYLGLNWGIAPVIPVLRQRLLAELAQVSTTPQVTAIDDLANNQRNMDRLRLKVQPIIDEKLRMFSAKMGYDRPMKSNFDQQILNNPMSKVKGMEELQLNFENDDELNMIFDGGYYSQKAETAEELTIKAILEYNQFDEFKTLLDEDAVDFGMCAFRTYIDNFTGMPRFQYMEPFKLYLPHSRYKDYRDAQMWYYRPPATLTDVLEQFGNELSEEDAKMIWEKASKKNPTDYNSYNLYGWDWRRWNYNDLKNIQVDLYYFEFKSPNCVTYEVAETKNGKKKLKKKSFDYEGNGTKKKQTYWAEVVYKGYYIEGIPRVYQWGMLKNMTRDEGREQLTPFSLNVYQFSEKGLTEMMIPRADQYQLSFLKRQHAIVKSLPKGYSFNWDALSAIDYGNAGKLEKQDLIKMYLQTGSTIHRTLDENGDPIMANANAPHMILENGIDPNIGLFTDVMRAEFEEMSLSIGLNPTSDAVNPNPRTLVGVSQMAAQASFNSRHFLYSGMKQVIIRTANYLDCQIKYIAKYNAETWEKIKGMVGVYNAAIIESMDDLSLHKFGFFINDEPTEKEMQDFKNFIMDAYSKGQVDLSDVMSIWFMKNYKLQIQLLNLKMKKRMQQAAAQGQQAMQMQQASEQQMAELKLLLEQTKGQMQHQNTEIAGKFNIMVEQIKVQGDYNKKLLQEINNFNLKTKQMETDKEIESMKESKKSVA